MDILREQNPICSLFLCKKSSKKSLLIFIIGVSEKIRTSDLQFRMYCNDAKIKHTICQHLWLIDFDDLMGKLNPKNYTERKTLPRLGTKKTAIEEWNKAHRKKIKHYIIDCICDPGKVFVMKNGRHNIINYDELEQELIKTLKEKGKY